MTRALLLGARVVDPAPASAIELDGRLVVGAPATYVVWDWSGPLDGDSRPARCLRTAHRGAVLYDTLTDALPPLA